MPFQAAKRRLGFAALALVCSIACARTALPRSTPDEAARGTAQARRAIVATALSMIGVRYRYGGSTPAGFDCSGLVVYSYRRAGFDGLPHSTAALLSLVRPIPERALAPGDLIFFELGGRKARHVAIYVGGRQFVHAPSSGKRVQRTSLDHVYWRARPRRAGRLLP